MLKILAFTMVKYTDASKDILNHPDFTRAANRFIDFVQLIPEENKMKKSELRKIVREEIQKMYIEKK